jgi:mono/diheme cytochrome c family protein
LLPDSDVKTIATYVAALMGTPSPERQQRGEQIRKKIGEDFVLASAPTDTPAGRGAAIYQAACATCHDGSRPLPFGGINFHLSSTINAPDAQNAINMVLFGLPAASGRQSAIMPGFAAAMTDEQLTDLLAYLRETFAGQPAWPDVAARAADTRSGKFQVSVRPSDGIERGPDDIGAQDQ